MTKKNKKGFTLIELLVVIAIIGLLTTLAVVALDSARTKSRDAKRVTDVKQIQTALELYFNDHNGYPGVGATVPFGTASTLSCIDDLGFRGTGITCGDADGNPLTTDDKIPLYMGQTPSDIQPYAAAGSGYIYSSQAALGACTDSLCPSYYVQFFLEGDAGELDGPGTFQATPEGVFKQ